MGPAFARPELVRLARRARRAADSGAAVADLAGLAGVAAAATQVHCVDAAREAARTAALGDLAGAHRVTAEIAPGAELLIRRDGGELRAEVTAPQSALLPGVHLHATAYAVPETADRAAPAPHTGTGIVTDTEPVRPDPSAQ